MRTQDIRHQLVQDFISGSSRATKSAKNYSDEELRQQKREERETEEELIEEAPIGGVTRVSQPDGDDLSERGAVGDENYDRDSYDFGGTPVEVRGDAATLSSEGDDPVVEIGESEYSIRSANAEDQMIELADMHAAQQDEENNVAPLKRKNAR